LESLSSSIFEVCLLDFSFSLFLLDDFDFFFGSSSSSFSSSSEAPLFSSESARFDFLDFSAFLNHDIKHLFQ
jgi:hypothetical protein